MTGRGKKRPVEASSGPESKKRRIDFVNETVDTLSSPDRLIPKDEASGKPLHSLEDAVAFFVFPTGSETGPVLLEGTWSMQEIASSAPIP